MKQPFEEKDDTGEMSPKTDRIDMILGAVCGLLALLIVVFAFKNGTPFFYKNTETKEKTESITGPEEKDPTPEVKSSPGGEETVPTAEPDVKPDFGEGFTESVSILCTGDNLMHLVLCDDAKKEDGTYDFGRFYAKVKDRIAAADIATVNQETPFATELGPASGFPHFNTPDEAGDALIDIGFDVFNLGNNHCWDMGAEGLKKFIEFFEKRGVMYCGAYKDYQDEVNMRIIEKDGIKVAFLGGINFLNNVEDDPPKDPRVVYLSNSEAMKFLIGMAKSQADVVVLHAHWGEEDSFEVTDKQREMAQEFADYGADIIFGNHTHTLEEMTMITANDGRQVPVFYSLGNFCSGQQEKGHLLSGLATVTMAKNPGTGAVKVGDISFCPVYTWYEGDRKNVEVVPLDELTDEKLAGHGVNQYEKEKGNDAVTTEYLRELVSKAIPEEYLVK